MKIAAMVGGGIVAVVLGSLLAANLSGCAGSAPVRASAFEDGWETVPLLEPRMSLCSVELAGGHVLLLGGSRLRDPVVLDSTECAEIYDPASGAFSPTGRMRGSGSRTATLLDDGRVLIVGGLGSVHRAAELYDPATGTFHESAELDWPRIQHVAVRLTDGRVLVAGGTGGDHRGRSTILDRVEIFDPRSETFLPAAPLNEARSSATAVALPEGAAIVAGGWTGVGASGTAEVYDPDRRH